MSVNNIAISISYIQRGYGVIAKTVHCTMNILLTKAELFATRYGISQVSQIQDIIYIVIITDAIYIAKYIFNTSIHSH